VTTTEQTAQATQLLELLADGRFHSGSELAEAFGWTRAGLWKLVERLRAQGVPVEAVKGKGYRLPEPVELLDAATISELLGPVHRIPVRTELVSTSTNSALLALARAGHTEPQALLAEIQNAGRGRWGRPWFAEFGAGLCVSVLWNFSLLPAGLAGLSLACAVELAAALRGLGAPVELKWPNDLISARGKLGGLLIELVGEPAGPCTVVIGLGLNLRLPQALRAAVDQPVACLADLAPQLAGQRNLIAASVIRALVTACVNFVERGFAPYQARWSEFDAYQGKQVVMLLPDRQVEGVVTGVDGQGALCLESADGVRQFFSGDLRLKLRREGV